MNQFKNAKVIMLETLDIPSTGMLLKRHIWKNNKSLECNTLWQFKEDVIIGDIRQYTTLNGSFRDIYTAFKPQHLYIISDDEIKEGDWFLENQIENLIFQRKNSEVYSLPKEAKKIIATTDTSLGLPQPSQQFIQKFIEEYNKGNIITDVLVEYEFNDFKFMATLCTTKEKEYNIKINSKNNTIIIKGLNKTFTPEEIKNHLSIVKTNDIKDTSGSIASSPEIDFIAKAKQLFPVGSKVSNKNLGINCTFVVTGNHFYKFGNDIVIDHNSTNKDFSYTVYCGTLKQWAELIENVSNLPESNISIEMSEKGITSTITDIISVDIPMYKKKKNNRINY